MKGKQSIQSRIVTAVDLAQDAFWETIVEHLPEATDGDLSPETTFAFLEIAEAAVAEWAWANVPGCGDLRIIKKLVDAERRRR